MSYAHYLKEIGRGKRGSRDLSSDEAYQLFSAMLDGGVPELELGAIVIAMRIKTESLSELVGFHRAASERVYQLQPAQGSLKPIVIPSYNGARHQANLLPLLALLLQRFGIPVLIHGTLEGNGRVATAYILRELGIMPSSSLAQVQHALDNEHLAFAPTAVLAPGLANLMSLRGRLGVRNSAHTIVKLIDPFGGRGLRMISVSHPAYIEKMREFMLETGNDSMLLRGTEGEAFANPKRRPLIEYFHEGEVQVLFEAEFGPVKVLPNLPEDREAKTTANWIRQVLAGESPLPLPLLNQLACCLFASGYTADMNQAKAIVAVETGSLAAA